jgi:hypothetical protein
VLPDIVLLTVHLAVAALALLALRIGLHHVLLHEQRDVRIGPPRICPHCHRVVPAMPFCPMCGVAERATSVGYMPGYGDAFQTTPNSADGNPVKFEVVTICAIRHGYAICTYAVGPQVDLNRIVNHPTEAKLALSLWAGPDLNGVRWKGESLP